MLRHHRLLFILLMLSFLSACFPHKAGKSLSHFYDESPKKGDIAPNFSLENLDGEIVELKDLVGSKPIVLQLGSHTCPVYRYRRFSMSKLYRDYAEKAHFLLVYTLEAHPKGAINPYVDREWVSSFNYATNTLLPAHDSAEMRMKAAQTSHEKLSISYPMVIDNMNNEIWKSYGRAPSAAFVIDQTGRIALRLPWVNPVPIRKVLDELL